MKVLKKLLRYLFVNFAVILLIVLVLPSSPVAAYSYSGYHWDSNVVYYDDGALDGDWRWEIWQAGYTWNEVYADFVFIQATNNSNNDIKIGETYDPNAIAETWPWYNGYHIIQTWIVFNQNYQFSVGGGGGTYDIQTVALHEFGHWLKLNDLTAIWDWYKVMYAYLGYGQKRSLSGDDMAGIIAIYGYRE